LFSIAEARRIGDNSAEEGRRMTETELNAKLSQLLTIVEAGFAGVSAEIAGLKTRIGGLETEVAGLKTEVAGVKTRLTAVENELIGIRTQQAIMNARLEDQWRIITVLIPTQIAAVGAAKSAA
jgi:archaellum component FlaC